MSALRNGFVLLVLLAVRTALLRRAGPGNQAARATAGGDGRGVGEGRGRGRLAQCGTKRAVEFRVGGAGRAARCRGSASGAGRPTPRPGSPPHNSRSASTSAGAAYFNHDLPDLARFVHLHTLNLGRGQLD